MDTHLLLQLLTLCLGFYMAWNIGANDVSNAMATSVGSKALTLKRAVLVAAVLEFSGAFLVGSHVSDTIQRGIIHPEAFQADPMTFVLGMLGALLATGVLLQLASYFALPVSTTHAIVGAVIGFGAVVGGMDAVCWSEVSWIATSWVISPLLSGLIAYALFRIIQKNILQAQNPLRATQKWAPYFVFLCFSAVTLSLLFQSFNLSLSLALCIAIATGLAAARISVLFVQRATLQLAGGTIVAGNQEAEKIFVFLQIISACLVAFAHGANDVANAIGPVAAILAVLKTGTLTSQTEVPTWLLALGGGGIVLGLATWGWRVIETVGSKITELTPTRGFAAEFGAAITILLASKLGLPISTTHALIGAVFGVGMAKGIKALNMPILKEIVVSWIVTIPLCAIFSIGAFYSLKFFL